MSDTLGKLGAFIADWRAAFETHADVMFEARSHSGVVIAPTHAANQLVSACGFIPIGFHWEMLDPDADPAASRSAKGAFVDALSKDLAMRSDWLGDSRALQCAEQFLNAFDRDHVTILTNHIVREGGKSEGWNPISTATLEWAFVGLDDQAIALLLLTAED